MTNKNRVVVAGVGMIPFAKPGASDSYDVMGATGLAQCYELTHQLRGSAEDRQVENAKIALQHNLGLGGACVVTLYEAA